MQQCHVQGQHTHTLEWLRHLRAGDAQGKAFDNRGLAHPGLADKDRIVLAPPHKDVDQLADLTLATQHRVDTPFLGLACQIMGKARQQ